MQAQSAIVDLSLLVWFVLTALATVYVAFDAFRRNPEMKVMRWGWVLVTLYTGPIGGTLYVLSCQEPRPNTHEQFVKPLWKQSLGSTVHCLAGDATGIIAAAVVTMALGLDMAVDIAVEYAFGFAFGLLVFQALFMREMTGGSYGRAVRTSLLPEWISMNAVMAGMIPVMGVLMTRHMSAMEPRSLRFWGVMSLATIVGAVIAYPFNVWLVAAKLKHGMGTVRALGAGGHALQAEGPSSAAGGHAAHAEASSPAPGGRFDVTVSGVDATRPQLVAVTLLSTLALGAGILLGALFGDLRMKGQMPAHDTAPAMTMPMSR